MDGTLAKKEKEFDPAALPYSAIQLAQSVDSPDELAFELELEEGVPDDLTREDFRAILRFAQAERELDQTALAPSSPSHLSSKIDIALNDEIDRLLSENKTYTKIGAMKDDSTRCKLKETQEVITPVEARDRMKGNVSRLLEMKKSLTEEKKAMGGPSDSSNVNINVDLGNIVTSAVDSIKNAEAIVTLDAQ